MLRILTLLSFGASMYFASEIGQIELNPSKSHPTVPLTQATYDAFLARPDVSQYWFNEIDKNEYTKVAEFGPGGVNRRFPRSNILIDHFANQLEDIPQGIITYQIDIDVDRVPVEDNGFDFVYCRHLMEDLNNPLGAFREMTRLSKRGYIETPSPLAESVEIDSVSGGMTGYPHHRFLFWTDVTTNTLYAIQKFPAINIIHREHYQLDQWVNLLQNHTYLFNNYYQWDIDAGLMPKIVMLKHAVEYNIEIPATYGRVIEIGAQLSVTNTQLFFNTYINPFINNQMV